MEHINYLMCCMLAMMLSCHLKRLYQVTVSATEDKSHPNSDFSLAMSGLSREVKGQQLALSQRYRPLCWFIAGYAPTQTKTWIIQKSQIFEQKQLQSKVLKVHRNNSAVFSASVFNSLHFNTYVACTLLFLDSCIRSLTTHTIQILDVSSHPSWSWRPSIMNWKVENDQRGIQNLYCWPSRLESTA